MVSVPWILTRLLFSGLRIQVAGASQFCSVRRSIASFFFFLCRLPIFDPKMGWRTRWVYGLSRRHARRCFFGRSRRCGTLTLFPGPIISLLTVILKSHVKIAHPDYLTLLAIRSDERRKSRERAHLANADKFNRRYLTRKISAILYADHRIKSPNVSLALFTKFLSFKILNQL